MRDGTEQIGRLLTSLTRQWRSILDARLAPLGMSQARWQCLLNLSRAGTHLSQVELAERMGITPPSLVKLLDRLEEDGWISRCPEPGDRRAKRVALTAKAQDMVRHIEAEASHLREEILAGTTVAERKNFLAMLLRLEKRVEELRPRTSPPEEMSA